MERLFARWSAYDRLVGEHASRQLTELYRALRLYVNCFQPSMKLQVKQRDGKKVRYVYDPARNPLQWLPMRMMRWRQCCERQPGGWPCSTCPPTAHGRVRLRCCDAIFGGKSPMVSCLKRSRPCSPRRVTSLTATISAQRRSCR